MNSKNSYSGAKTGRLAGKSFLRAPLKSDELSILKAGGSTDCVSFMALYKSEGREEGITSPLNLDAHMATIVLQDMDAFVLRRNRKDIRIPPCKRGTFGFQDLRNSYSCGKYPVFSLSFVFSKAFLQELRPSRRYGAADLEESANYLDRDDTLLHLASSLVPSFSHSEPNQLFVDQLFLATSTYLVSKFGARVPLSSPKGRLAPRQEKMAKEFLDSNIRANVSLEEVASLCELSTPQFARLFKRSTGMTPYQWFIRRRLREAKFLLESSEDSLAEIGLACGFADQSHFTRTFSRLVGLSPGAWRRRERQ